MAGSEMTGGARCTPPCPSSAATVNAAGQRWDCAGLGWHSLFAAMALLGSGSALRAEEPQADRSALVALYNATSGPSWKDSANWLTAAPLSEWSGVRVNDSGRVHQLFLPGNGLRGELPSELATLGDLELLDLSNNRLRGPIPPALGGLARLRGLYLSRNSLTGAIPGELGDLASLESLGLWANALSGPIPPEFGQLARLRVLSLDNNRLSGTVPAALGDLDELEDLWLQENDLDGELPIELARLSKLALLLTYENETCAPGDAAFRFWLASLSYEGALCPPETVSVVDVAFAYTAAAQSHWRGAHRVRAELTLMITEANFAYDRSGADLQLSLAGSWEVSYAGSDSPTDLGRLAEPADGFLDEVHELRDSSGADIVVLVVGPQAWPRAGNGVCGQAYKMTEHLLSGSFAPWAFAVMAADCGSPTFVHELGHIMGVSHDRHVSCRGGTCDEGAFPYSYGYVNQQAFDPGANFSGRWHTIMAYDGQCRDAGFRCFNLMRFSSPARVHLGDPMGVPGQHRTNSRDGPSDAVRTLNRTREIVASFRPPGIPGPPREFSFAAEAYVAAEGGRPASVTLNMSPPATADTAVPLTVALVNGASFEDFSGVPLTLRFAEGQGAVTFEVVATDDSDDDDGERIVLGLGPLVAGAMQGDPPTAVLALADDDLTERAVRLPEGGEILLRRNGAGPWTLDGRPVRNGAEVVRDGRTHVLELADGDWRLARHTVRSAAGRTASEEGMPATQASLLAPRGVATDSQGNIFVADSLHHRIRVIDATGAVFTWAGTGDWGDSGDGGPATAARLHAPSGLAVGTEGDLYFSDTFNHRVRRVDGATRMIETVAGTGRRDYSGDGAPAASASLAFPQGLALSRAGDLYIADLANFRVRRVAAATGTIETVPGIALPAEARVVAPSSVAVGAAGYLFITDRFNHRVLRADLRSGTAGPVAGSAYPGSVGTRNEALDSPEGLTADASGNLFVADTGNHRILRIDTAAEVIEVVAGTGVAGYSGDGGPATEASLSYPEGVALDARGDLLVADTGNHRIRRVDRQTSEIGPVAGIGSAVLRWAGGRAEHALLGRPASLAVLPDGSAVFIDSQRVWTLNAAGMVERLAGTGESGHAGDGGLATDARFRSPQGISVGPAGDILVADTGNHRIRRIHRRTGMIETVAGSGEDGYSGDGGPAAAARLSRPEGIATDAAGNLYIADTGNRRVRRVNLATDVIETIAGTAVGGNWRSGRPASETLLLDPVALAVDRRGNLLVADRNGNRVIRVDARTELVSTTLSVETPEAVAIDDAGNVIVGLPHRILQVGPNGAVSLLAGNGRMGFAGDGEPAGGAELSVSAVAAGPSGMIWFADPGGRRIRVIEPLGSGARPEGSDPARDGGGRPEHRNVGRFLTGARQ